MVASWIKGYGGNGTKGQGLGDSGIKEQVKDMVGSGGKG